MITGFFGVIGCGKTTTLTRFAQRELKRIRKNKSKYKSVYTNFYCKGCKKISFDELGEKEFVDSLLIFDEMTLSADNRDFKNFKKRSSEFLILSRHYNCDIIFATQDYENVDKRIRTLTSNLYYLRKSYFFPFTIGTRVFRTITINEYMAELVHGYKFAGFWEILAGLLGIFRLKYITFCPKYYKYFDSFDRPLNLVKKDSEVWTF